MNSLEKNDSWSIIRLDSILDFTLVGILADISTILKESEISIFALSTFNTDYIMVKKDKLDKARNALIKNGYEFKQAN